jgi:hypothetical protein
VLASHASNPTPVAKWIVACHQHDRCDAAQKTATFQARHRYGTTMTAFVANAQATHTATVHRSTTCRTSKRYLAMLVAEIARNGDAKRTCPRNAHANAGTSMNRNDHAIGHRAASAGQTHLDNGFFHGFIPFADTFSADGLSRGLRTAAMERTCKRCRADTADFKKVVDPDLGVLSDSICRACRSAEPKPKKSVPKKKVSATPVVAASPPVAAAPSRPAVKVPPKEAREALKAYKLGDVRDPISLITGPCHFTGVAPAMCLDLLDRRGRADDGNVVPCGYYVRAARGRLSAAEFVDLCTAIADSREQTPAQVRESMAMSARYDAAGGCMFMDMCRACTKLAEA